MADDSPAQSNWRASGAIVMGGEGKGGKGGGKGGKGGGKGSRGGGRGGRGGDGNGTVKCRPLMGKRLNILCA